VNALRAVADGLWIAEGPEVDFHGFPYPTRMVIVRLDGGSLWAWSPIEASAELFADLARIGPVSHLISPNRLHHLFLAQWQERFPQALLWGPASTIAMRPGLAFAPALTDQPPAAWRHEIDQAWFRGSPLLDEVVFFHKASRVAIFGDLVQAFDDNYLRRRWTPWQRRLARLLGITASSGARAPLDVRLSFLNRRWAREARTKVLNWRPECVVMAHGEWQRHDGFEFIQRSLSWIG